MKKVLLIMAMLFSTSSAIVWFSENRSGVVCTEWLERLLKYGKPLVLDANGSIVCWAKEVNKETSEFEYNCKIEIADNDMDAIEMLETMEKEAFGKNGAFTKWFANYVERAYDSKCGIKRLTKDL